MSVQQCSVFDVNQNNLFMIYVLLYNPKQETCLFVMLVVTVLFH